MKKYEMDSFALKIVAMATMLIDHAGSLFFPDILMFRIIGRLAWPIYALLMAETFIHTRKDNKRCFRHIVKLLALALVSELPFNFLVTGNTFSNPDYQNILFSLLIGYSALLVADKTKNNFLKLFIYLIALAITHFSLVDYYASGVFMIISMYYYLNKRSDRKPIENFTILLGILLLQYLMFIAEVSIIAYGSIINFQSTLLDHFNFWIVGVMMSSFVLVQYNGELGFNGKAFKLFYNLFYPAHIIVLDVVFIILNYGVYASF